MSETAIPHRFVLFRPILFCSVLPCSVFVEQNRLTQKPRNHADFRPFGCFLFCCSTVL